MIKILNWYLFENKIYQIDDSYISDILLPLKDNRISYSYEVESKFKVNYLKINIRKFEGFIIDDVKHECYHLISYLESLGLKLEYVEAQYNIGKNRTRNVTFYDSNISNRWGIKMPKDDIFSNVEGLDMEKKINYIFIEMSF